MKVRFADTLEEIAEYQHKVLDGWLQEHGATRDDLKVDDKGQYIEDISDFTDSQGGTVDIKKVYLPEYLKF